MKIVCVSIMEYETDVLTIGKIYEVKSRLFSDMYYPINDNTGGLYFAIKENFVTLREANLNKLI